MSAGALLVMGAGNVGCFVGGSLQAAGAQVHYVGRPRVLGALRVQGLTLTDLTGQRHHLPPGALSLSEDVPASRPSLVLLCVKSGATLDAAAALGRALPRGTPVLSLQNGIGNAAMAQDAAPALEVIAGMVPFNVAEVGPGHFHRGTSGSLAGARHPALDAWMARFEAAAVPLTLHDDMRAVQWGKLLLNLNNPVNALSELPLRDELLNRGYRRVLAAMQSEALQVLRAARIDPARLTPLPPSWLPALLRLPTPLFRLLAARMLQMDAKARSSMADDLAHGRLTEVDALCGEVVRMARGLGMDAPVNARMATLVHSQRLLPQRYDAPRLLHALGLAKGSQPLTKRTEAPGITRSGSGSASNRSKPQ
jgi:2-dehydropantoate 2-reductase